MTKNAAQLREIGVTAVASGARIIDIRTRQAWRPPAQPDPRYGPFLFDMIIIVGMVCLGAWLFLKMQGG